MISPASWWWPNRPPRVPTAWTAGLLAGLGVALFGASALLVKAGTISWDARLFRILNQVPPAVASVLTPLSHLFLPTGIIAVVVLTVVYAVARNRSVLPVAAAAVAAGAAWVLAHVAKAIADRPRPYEVMAGDGAAPAACARHELSLQPHRRHRGGSHRARAVPDPAAGRRGGSATPSWWAGPGCTWGCTIPWTSWPELVLGSRLEASACWPSRRCSAVQAGQRTATTPRPMPRPHTPAPSPTVSHDNSGIAPEGPVLPS